MKLKSSVFAAILAAATMAGCAQEERQGLTIQVDGSSTVGPISKQMAEQFNATAPTGVSVTVAESGTGGGFKKFCAGQTQITGASRPIKASEMAACQEGGVQFIELPVAFDALTVVVNPENPVNEITVDQLKTIWQPAAEGTIDNWNKVDPTFPDLPLTLSGPGTASGTFDYFTQAIVGEEGSSRTDYAFSENDNNIVLAVQGAPGAMGYFGLAYYLENQATLKALAIKATPDAPAVTPSVETVLTGAYVPLARPVFIYVNAAELEKGPVREFVNFYIDNVAAALPGIGYVPLPDTAYAASKARVEAGTVGTAFGGEAQVGASIEEVMQRELTLDAPAAAE